MKRSTKAEPNRRKNPRTQNTLSFPHRNHKPKKLEEPWLCPVSTSARPTALGFSKCSPPPCGALAMAHRIGDELGGRPIKMLMRVPCPDRTKTLGGVVIVAELWIPMAGLLTPRRTVDTRRTLTPNHDFFHGFSSSATKRTRNSNF